MFKNQYLQYTSMNNSHKSRFLYACNLSDSKCKEHSGYVLFSKIITIYKQEKKELKCQQKKL